MNGKRTKIIATIGPSTSDPARLRGLVSAGANVFRLNFSHGTHAQHLEVIRATRKLSKKLKTPIGLLADLPGPKLRTGNLPGGKPVVLKKSSVCILTTSKSSVGGNRIPVQFRDLPKLVSPGDHILLADGKLELKVLKRTRTDIVCKVLLGGELGDNKGINLPGMRLPIPILTKKDREAIAFLAKHPVDYLALSFVQSAKDLVNAKRFMKKSRCNLPVIAKIEKPEALEEINEIIRECDGIMIARGDLGVEVPTAQVPIVQKQLIHLASARALPVITATQMLESMIDSPKPTRAETTDVANAIWDGTDAVMLSGETASGKYPKEAVATMREIIRYAEASPGFHWTRGGNSRSATDAEVILRAATDVAKKSVHKAIVTYTKTGSTAIALSKLRPEVPIFAITTEIGTYYRLSLIWGVRPLISSTGKSVDEMIRNGDRTLIREGALKKGDRIVAVAGTKLSTGATNIMKIHIVGD